jgi:lambda repressor-like predicted transcriptional regulator
MSDTRETDRQWIAGILRERGWHATDLARRAGVNQTTLTRFLNNPDHPYDLSERTRAAIARTIGLVPSTPVAAQRPPATGFFEPDATEYDVSATPGSEMAQMVRDYLKSRPHLSPWVLMTGALASLGWQRGDLLMVDLNARAEDNDLVCAQIYDWPRNRAETVFRVYQTPFLMTGPENGQIQRPLMVDNQNIVIKGVVTCTIRPRQMHGRHAA